jgi:hypothetical protein
MPEIMEELIARQPPEAQAIMRVLRLRARCSCRSGAAATVARVGHLD